jgi:hypothetical protein
MTDRQFDYQQEHAMPTEQTANAVLNREFLTMRSRLIELAAALDRIDRAEGSAGGDERLQQVRQALGVLSGDQPGRAERVQQVFSLGFQDDWQAQFGVAR